MNDMRRAIRLFPSLFRLGLRLLGDIIVRLDALGALEMNLKEFVAYGPTSFPWWTFRSIFVR
jgi:hypothetical protein